MMMTKLSTNRALSGRDENLVGEDSVWGINKFLASAGREGVAPIPL